jgi:PGF-pre-PGF domain-containing protein
VPITDTVNGEYQTNLLNTDIARPLFLPSAVDGGSETTNLSDKYWAPKSIDAATPNILFSGGAWYDKGGAGIGSLVVDNDASLSSTALGARLEFRFSVPGASFSSRNISVATNSTSQGWAGVAPFTIVFNDTSTNTPTSWAWGRNNLTVTAWEQFSTTNNATQAFVLGNWSINLTAANGVGSSISGITWVNVSAGTLPTFTSITPNSGTTAGGTAVTITGTNLLGATGVTFGGTAATSYTVDSATQITAVTPAKAAGAVNVVVTTPGGTATGAYTYVAPAPAPTPDGGSDGFGPAAPVAPAKSSTSDVNVGGNSAVTHVAITGTGISDAIVTSTVVSGPGQNTAPPTQLVYEYVDITPARYTTIDEAVISFTVPVTWLTEHQLTPQNVVMYHLVGQTWVALPTTLVKVVNEAAYYTAVGPGFSRFAITGQFNITSGTPLATLTPAGQTYGDLSPATATKTPTPAAVTVRPVTTQTTAIPAASQPAPALPLQTIAIVGGVVVVLVAGGFLIRRWWIRRQNPALFREND